MSNERSVCRDDEVNEDHMRLSAPATVTGGYGDGPFSDPGLSALCRANLQRTERVQCMRHT
jgi:hypothetical protein